MRSAERSRGPLWVWPALAGAAGAAAAAVLTTVPAPGWAARLWPAGRSTAGTLLQAVATAAVTATTLAFSITVVALQLASQQYSPRLLRTFVHDPVIKWVLVVLTGAFTYALVGLRGVHQEDRPAAALLCLGAAVLGTASFGAVLAFTTHMVRTLRVDTMMLRVHDEASRAITAFYPAYDDDTPRSPDECDLDAAKGRLVTSSGSGYVRMVDVGHGVAAARDAGLLVRVEVRPGDHVVQGSPLATAWALTGGPADAEADEIVRESVVIGYERTLDQDAAFGVRQLEDIAVKAMSPGINDPVTASTAVGHMADLLVKVTGCRLGATLHADEDGIGRLIVPDRDLRYYLDLACGQLRRFGSGEPTVLMALMRLLREVGRACRDDAQRAEVLRAADLVIGQLSPDVLDDDADAVRDMRRRVVLAVEGRVHEAYADRSGETRSI